MKYKYLGCDMVAGCTPAPMTMFDTKSCRERTGCTKECIPKKLKCPQCGKMFSRLNLLENIDTGEKISICNECKVELTKITCDKTNCGYNSHEKCNLESPNKNFDNCNDFWVIE